MSTGTTWANLFPTRVLDLAALSSGLAVPLRAELGATMIDLWGSGGVFTALAAFTVSSSRLSLTTSRTAWTGDGHRLLLNTAGRGFASVPFENTGATVYHLGARYAEKPSGAILGFEGTPGFLVWEEAIGELLAAGSRTVANRGGGLGLRFTVTGALSAAQKWTNAAHTRPATIWKVNPATGTADAVAAVSIATDGAGAFWADVGHYFGQDAGAPSLVSADYAVLLEGVTITTSAGIATDPLYVYLGSLNTGVHTTGGLLLNPVGPWITAYNVEHDPITGFHTAIRPTSIAARGGSGDDLEITGDQVAVVADVGGSAVAEVLARSAGSKARLRQAGSGVSVVELRQADGSILIEATTGAVRVDAVAAALTLAGATVVAEDRLDLSKGASSTPNATSGHAYEITGSQRYSWAIPLTGWTTDGAENEFWNLKYDATGDRGLLFSNVGGSASLTFLAARDLDLFEAPPTGTAAVYVLERVWFDVLWGTSGTFSLAVHEIDRSTGAIVRSSTRGPLTGSGVFGLATAVDLGWVVNPSLYRYVVEVGIDSVATTFTGINLRGGWIEYGKKAAV